MSASAEQGLLASLREAQHSRQLLQQAQERERYAVVGYIDAALAVGWGWERIGRALGVTGTGARRYFNRNNRKVHGGV